MHRPPPATRSPRRRSAVAAWAAIAVVGLIVAACAGVTPAVNGGTVRMLGSWEGPELDAFKAMVRPFEERTGIRVDYSGTRDLDGTLRRSIDAGDPPDIAGVSGPGSMRALFTAGKLRAIGDAIDQGTYKAETAPAFVSLGTVDEQLVGVFIKATLKGLIWYDPNVYRAGVPSDWNGLVAAARATATGDTKPWCLGLESGAASGWPGTDWVEDLLLRQSGPQVYDDWVAGRLAWTSPQVRQAFLTYGQVAADGAVAGGSPKALRTYFGDAGAGLFTRPPGCVFLHQGSFMTTFFDETASGAPNRPDYDFFPFPTIDPRYAGAVIGGGDLVGLVRSTPASRELLRYLVSAEAQQILVNRGGAVSGNLMVKRYPSNLALREAQVLATATAFRFDGSDAMPAPMTEAFNQAMLDFTRDQSGLDDILAHLDAVRSVAYASP